MAAWERGKEKQKRLTLVEPVVDCRTRILTQTAGSGSNPAVRDSGSGPDCCALSHTRLTPLSTWRCRVWLDSPRLGSSGL